MRAIESVRDGMQVVDVDGEDVGTVETVMLGEADGGDVEQIAAGPGAFLGVLARGIPDTEPDVPEEQAERLRQVGYLKIDGSGPLGGHFYAAADSIDHIADDRVHLAFRRGDVQS